MLDVAQAMQSVDKAGHAPGIVLRGVHREDSDARPDVIGSRHQRPRHRTPEPRDKLAPSHRHPPDHEDASLTHSDGPGRAPSEPIRPQTPTNDSNESTGFLGLSRTRYAQKPKPSCGTALLFTPERHGPGGSSLGIRWVFLRLVWIVLGCSRVGVNGAPDHRPNPGAFVFRNRF
jgi:hypothetical protein